MGDVRRACFRARCARPEAVDPGMKLLVR